MKKAQEKKLDQLLSHVGDMALKRRAWKIVLGLDPQKGDKILDVGCGDGFYLHLLSNLGLKLKLTGTDYDTNGLKSAKKNLDKGITLVQSDLMKKLPFKDNTFDKVVMSEVAEHLPDDVKGLKEVYRVLKPGGLICITVPNANYPILWDPVNWVMEKTTGKHVKEGFWAGLWSQHIRLYKPEQLEKVATKAGFKVLERRASTWWSLPFNHNLIYATARVLYGGKISPELAQSISKFERGSKKKISWVDYAFRVVNLNDKVNDLFQPKNVGVGVFLKAQK